MSDFYQSTAWQQFQRDLGIPLITGAGKGWRYFARVQSDGFGTYVYAPGGPVVESTAALEEAIAHLKREAKAVGAYRAVIEPTPPVTADDMPALAERRVRGFRHSRTQAIDLTRPWDVIFSELSTSRRKQFRGAEKRGMIFAESRERADFDEFLRLYRAQGDAKDHDLRDDAYFEAFYESLVKPGVARVFVAVQHGKTEVVGITIDDDESGCCYYLYVGRDLGNNSLQISSPFITWMMKEAKDRGLRSFDLFGISESDEVEDAATGYTVFKRTFGGETQTFAGSWEIAVAPAKYRLWRAALAAKHAIRR
jgi:lipid II:glycine glycyltransferase (peptidoglycan interpeptide bridge formation enzyme)